MLGDILTFKKKSYMQTVVRLDTMLCGRDLIFYLFWTYVVCLFFPSKNSALSDQI